MVPNLAELKMEVDACFLAGETEKTISLIEEIYAVCDEWMAIPPGEIEEPLIDASGS